MSVPDEVTRLGRLDVCAVSDALDRLGIGAVVTGVPQQAGSGRLAGQAVTMKVGVGDPPPGPPRHLGCNAIESAGPGDLIVVEQRSGRDAGCWGGLLTLAAKLRGVRGVVADGPVRDIDEAVGYGFPVFTRHLTARTARGRVAELGSGVPIVFEGARVNPGDYIVADRSGIAIIPRAEIGKVLEVAEGIVAKEAAMARQLLAGQAVGDVMGGNYEFMLKGTS
ncbi:regulator of RNase E activity RraA [Novosphingobium sp. 1529]|uniref:RraA family protein n=1 Tax=Novosphingobium sp. 1529 TaxID=3156424 RepID=UPI0014940922